MQNELNEVLKRLSFKKAQYIRWKFNLWMDINKTMTEEEFLKTVDLKSINTFLRWERTNEFKHVVSLVLQGKQASDLMDIYDKVKKSLEGDNPDNKRIEIMLKLMKEINSHAKEASKYFTGDVEVYDSDDGIEL